MTPQEMTNALEERLIDFTVRIVQVSRALPNDYVGQHFGKQILRSGSAPALLYGEARGAESRKDFRHKLSVAVKELRETHINLKIVIQAELLEEERMSEILKECNELISILTASIKTIDHKIRNGLK